MTTIQKVLRITRPKCCCVAFPAKIPLILSPFFCKTIVCDFMAVDSLKAFFNRVTDAFGITDKNTTLSNWGFHNRCNVMPIIFLYMISVPCKSRWLGLLKVKSNPWYFCHSVRPLCGKSMIWCFHLKFLRPNRVVSFLCYCVWSLSGHELKSVYKPHYKILPHHFHCPSAV